MHTNVPTIAVTCGEPAGIGPELLAMLAQRHAEQRSPARLVFVGDRGLLSERAQRIGLAPLYVAYDPAAFAPKAAKGGHAVRILYGTQVGIAPPTFVLSLSHPVDLHFSYKRYLENQIRRGFGFEGAPIVLKVKTRRH